MQAETLGAAATATEGHTIESGQKHHTASKGIGRGVYGRRYKQPKWDTAQIPFAVKYDAKPIWPALRDAYDVTPTGAAVILAGVEAALIGNAVSYSRNRNWYGARARHPLMNYRKVVSAVDALDRDGLIHHWRQVPGGLGWQSAFTATDALVEAVLSLTDYRALRFLSPRRLTVLRGAEGQEQDYRQTRAIERQDRRTAAFNECIGAADLGGNINPPMVRIFNRNFKRGGRFYGMGASWQNIESEQRRAITINGEAVVELDYATLHPGLLYHEAGADMPADSYAIDGWPRKAVKVATLTMINAKTEAAARLSIAHSVLGGGQEAIGQAAELIRAIKAKHRPIANAFHSDAGARLMYLDASIAEDVMALLIIRHGVVTLPVHDSFLVPASKRDWLEDAMLQAAFDVCGLRAKVTQKGA